MIFRPSNWLALVFVALLCVGFAPAAFGEETADAAADIPSLVSAIENATDSNAAGAVYNGARRKGIEHVDLAQAYVHKMVEFGKVLQAMEAATKVTRARDDDATAWGVLSYCHSLRRRHGPAIDAAARVADLTPKDPVAMENIGELMGWLVSQTELPELSADARRIMAANQNTWPTDANYVRGYQRISTAYKAFANKLKAKKNELDGLRERGEKLVEQIGNITEEIKTSLAWQRQMEQAGAAAPAGDAGQPSGGGVGQGKPGDATQQNPYQPQIDAEKKRRKELRARKKKVEVELKKVRGKYKKVDREAKGMERSSTTLIEKSGGKLALKPPTWPPGSANPPPAEVAGGTEPPAAGGNEATPAGGGDTPPETPAEPVEVVIDNNDVSNITGIGIWNVVQSGQGAVNGTVMHDNNAKKGKMELIYAVTLPRAGNYNVFFNNIGHPESATNVPIEIVHADGSTSVLVNQRAGGMGWIKMGSFRFTTSAPAKIILRTTNTDGYVLMDAVKFVSP